MWRFSFEQVEIDWSAIQRVNNQTAAKDFIAACRQKGRNLDEAFEVIL